MQNPTRSRALRLIAGLVIVLGLCAPPAEADVPTRGPVLNIVEWDGGALPPVYERSDQLPLTREDILKLSSNEFGPDAIVRMIQERRFVGNASADALIDLKKAGVDPRVIAAVSRHALPPNRSLRLTVQLEFEGTSDQARQRYLYILIPDGPTERLLTADLGAILSGRWQQDILVDQTDPLLPRQVRRISFTGEIPLKTYGEKTLRIFTSAAPHIAASSDIPEADRPHIREHRIEYPAASLRRDCRLLVRYRQDVLIPYKWTMTASHLQCEWN